MAVKKNLRLIFSNFKLNVKKEWQYKPSFFMQIIMMIFNDLFFIVQWQIVFSLVADIGGYGFKETMIMWAVSAGAFGIARGFFNGAWHMKDIIYEGKLDVYLTQPKNVLLNLCTSSSDISAFGDLIYCFVVLAIVGASWQIYLIMIPAIILSGILYASIYVTYSTLAFYVKRGDALATAVESTLLKAANYPPKIFNAVVKAVLFSIIPALFYVFVPVEYTMLSPNIWWILGYIGFVALWIGIAFLTFKLGLKKYNSGSLMGGRL